MSNNPQHGCPIKLIESIAGINEQKSPFFRSMVDIPGMLHEVNSTFNTSRQASTELINTTGLSSSRTSNLKNALGKHLAPSVTNANGPNSWIFVQGQETASHEGLVGSPGRETICKPASKASNNSMQDLAGFTKPCEPI